MTEQIDLSKLSEIVKADWKYRESRNGPDPSVAFVPRDASEKPYLTYKVEGDGGFDIPCSARVKATRDDSLYESIHLFVCEDDAYSALQTLIERHERTIRHCVGTIHPKNL